MSRPAFRRRLLLSVLAAVSGAYALWACGPFFPAWILDDESRLTASPVTFLRDEAAHIKPPSVPAAKARPAEKGGFRQTFETDQSELATALLAAKIDPAKRRTLIEGVIAFRLALLAPLPAEASPLTWGWTSDPPPPLPPAGTKAALPAGLPGEFEDYLRGAEAFYRKDAEGARKAWNKLLGRPAAERHYRSTWAAYMLGRLAADSNPDDAVKWFERTRKFAADKFADSLGLAAASYGWQGRAEFKRGRFEEAIDLYLIQLAAGDPRAARSLRVVAGKVFADPKALDRVVRAPRARSVLIAYVLSRWDDESWTGPDGATSAKALLGALARARVDKAEEADRLAWAAYRGGDFDAADAWLKRLPAKTPMGEWIRAKLLARAGKLGEAESILESVRAELPPGLKDADDMSAAYDVGAVLAVRPRAHGEVGFLQLAQGQFQEALLALLHGSYWTDAAYVAERVMTQDELRLLVDRRYPAPLAARYKPNPDDYGFPRLYSGMTEWPEERVAYSMRYLLGRRLARDGQYNLARAYLPDLQRSYLEDFAASLIEGRDTDRPSEERSRRLLRAACLARYRGMQIFGTELEPDWFLDGGAYDEGSFFAARAEREKHPHSAPGKEEVRRVRASTVDPDKRFHYRFRAAALGVEAANLFPEGSNDRAVALAAAGSWIKSLEPAAADPIYKLLIRCCAKTQVGKEAVKLKWFPVVNACSADTRPKSGESDN